MDSVHNTEILNQLEDTLRQFVKASLENIMKEELNQVLASQTEHTTKNGSYTRLFDTRFGRITLNVPRDRKGLFRTQVFRPYQRRDGWLEEAVIRMYASGMSTRDIAAFIERILGSAYSPTTISNITEAATEEILAWQQRPLQKRYSVLYLDALFVPLRRDTVEQESIYLAMGVNLDGYREILGFYVGGRESATGWKEVLEDLYRRGLHEVLLGVFDGLPGLEEAFRSVYPKADVQRCMTHKMRNTTAAVRQKDRPAITADLKKVYQSPTYEIALQQFAEFQSRWQKKYPREVASWERDLPVLLTFYRYPNAIHSVIYTTNWIERNNKEFRKRLRPMNSIPSIHAAEKVVYFKAVEINTRWSQRRLKGFAEAKAELIRMFEARYPSDGD
ncbi:MAG: IS256 family transposase [Clostridia bacterium]|jgi:transposase-like protein